MWLRGPILLRSTIPTRQKTSEGFAFWNSSPGQNLSKQIDALKNIAITLAMNLKAQGATSQLAHLAPIFVSSKRKRFCLDSPNLPSIVLDNLEYEEADAGALGAVGQK
jgi:hypothetical protein